MLELSQIASVTNESVMKIVHHCPHLESLALSLCTGITDTCVDYIARNARNLRSLHLVSCSLTDSGRCVSVPQRLFNYIYKFPTTR